MATSNLNAGGNPAMDQHPIQGRVEILPAINQDKFRPDGPLGLYADFTLPVLFILYFLVGCCCSFK